MRTSTASISDSPAHLQLAVAAGTPTDSQSEAHATPAEDVAGSPDPSSEADEKSQQRRKVYVQASTQKRFRLVERTAGKVWLMPMDKRSKGWPVDLDETSFDKACTIGAYEPVTSDERFVKPTATAQKHGEKTFQRLKVGLSSTGKLLTERGRAETLALLQDVDKKLSKSYFFKHLRRWFVGGCTPMGLAAQWERRNAPSLADTVAKMDYTFAVKTVQDQCARLMGEPYVAPEITDYTSKKKAPRRRKQPRLRTRFRTTIAAKRVFLHYFRKYFVSPGMTLRDAWGIMLREVFSTRQPTGELLQWADHLIPSYAEFHNTFYALTDPNDRARALHGERDFELNGRAKLGQQISAGFSAGSVGGIDATVWNVELVGEGDDAPLIGPAVVFRIRCKDTGMLLGLSVSLESASWLSAATAIANCLDDKTEFCLKHGIVIAHDTWRARGLPSRFEADCGETHNHKPNAFIRRTGVDLRNLTAGRGDLKGGTESDFFVIQTRLNGKTPGAIIKEYCDKNHTQWIVKARMTVKQFTALLILEELKRMREVRESRSLPIHAVDAGYDTSALGMWNYSVRFDGGGLSEFPEQEVRLSLLETDTASITESGLLFKGLLYKCDPLSLGRAFERARARRRELVNVVFDQRLVDHIYLVTGDPQFPQGYTECTLNVDRMDQRKYAGRCFREVWKMMTRQSEVNDEQARVTRTFVADLSAQQDKIIAEGAQRVEQARLERPISNNALVTGRAAAREMEKFTHSPTLALVPALPLPPTAADERAADGPALPPAGASGVETPSASSPATKPRRGGFAARAAAIAERSGELARQLEDPR
jgi:hypothetical protein